MDPKRLKLKQQCSSKINKNNINNNNKKNKTSWSKSVFYISIICILALILKQIPERHANEHKLVVLLKSPVGICHLCGFYFLNTNW